jgi:MSHA pilin protein MshC
MKQRGFTMVELIVIMLIVGIMAIAAVSRMDSLRGFDEIGFRDQVRATLEYARKSAVAGRRFVCVGVRAGNTGLVVTRDQSDPDITALAAVNCNLPGSFPLNLPGTQANTIVAPAGIAFAGPAAAVIFDPLGRAWGPADDCDPISTTQYCYSIQDAASPAAQIVRLERETGYVR